jgi:3-phosphoshikimate 1-carboxyvinyltransferase
MQVKLIPSSIGGSVFAPASKSAMQRACALALLHNGQTIVTNPGQSNDDKAALSIIEHLGALVQKKSDDKLSITGNSSLDGFALSENGNSGQSEVEEGGLKESIGFSCGESGLSIRMFTPIAALSSTPVKIIGSGSLLTRPMDFFDEILPKLGVEITSNDGKLPIVVSGPLLPKDITVDGSLSSQFLTGLLIAFAKAAVKPVTISVTDLKSKPYVDLTLHMMSFFGYAVKNENYERFHITPSATAEKSSPPSVINYTVEGDWSGAAFLLVAGVIAGKTIVKGLDVFSTQADKAILQALMMSKAIISITPEEITVEPAVALQPFQFDATDCPDLFPPLVALAAYCDGTSVIEGVSRLMHKESNRALTLQEEFGKLGVVIKLQDDLMIIEGGTEIHGAEVRSHHDHRIAMALAVAALKATGETTIDDAEAINKSYPTFYEHLQHLGASVHFMN